MGKRTFNFLYALMQTLFQKVGIFEETPMATFKTVPTSATALSAGRRAQPLPTKPQLPARSNLVERDSFLFATLRFRFSRNSSDFRTRKFFKNLFSDSESKFESRFILSRSVSVDSVLTARYVQQQQHWPSSCSSAALLACLPNLHPNCPLISLIDSYVHAAVPLRLPLPATFFTFRVKQGAFSRASSPQLFFTFREKQGAFSRASMGLDPRSTQAIFSATF